MATYEYRQIGNMTEDDIKNSAWETDYRTGQSYRGMSLADQWARQGITYELTDPVPSAQLTSEQLRAMGLFGVTLVIPEPEAQ